MIDVAKIQELVDKFLLVISQLEVDPEKAAALELQSQQVKAEAEKLLADAADLLAQAETLRQVDQAKIAAATAIYAEIGALLQLVVPTPDPTPEPTPDPTPEVTVGASTELVGVVLRTTSGDWKLVEDVTAPGSNKIAKDNFILPETNNVTKLEIATAADGVNTTIKQYAWGTSWTYEPTHTGADVNGWLVDGWTPPVSNPDPTPAPSDPSGIVWTTFPTEPVVRWNYNQVYHPIEGPQAGKQPAGWAFLFNNVVPQPDGSLVCKVTNFGAAAIKWEAEKKLNKTQGRYLVKARLPQLKNGIVSNPLWLYSEGAVEPGHEYDFELMNGRIEYNLHNGNGGALMKSVQKDLSGHEAIFEIDRRPGKTIMRVTSLTDGFTDELVITPEFVAELAAKPGAPVNLRMPGDNIPMFPANEQWVSKWPEWSGTWSNLPTGESIDLVMLGYSFQP